MSSADGFNPNTKKGAEKSYYGVPGVRDIADILYGLESNGGITIADKNGKRLYAELGRRLLPCIWDNRNVPYDLVMAAVHTGHLCLRHIKSGITGSGF